MVNENGSQPINNPPLMVRPNSTPKITCPAVILANSLTAKEIGRANWLIISIITINGIIKGGFPEGTSIALINFGPWILSPKTMLSVYTKTAKTPVTTS